MSEPTIIDPAIVRAAQAGSPQAKADLVAQLEPLIWSIAHSWSVPGLETSDLHQEAVLAVLTALPVYDPDRGASLTTWTHTVITIRLRDLKRSATAGCRYSPDLISLDELIADELAIADTIPDAADTEAEALGAMITEQVDQLIVDPTDRRILDLLLEQYSQAEVARELGCSPQAVSKRLSRIRRKVGHLFE